LPCRLFFFFLFSSPNLSRRRLDVCHHAWRGLRANSECRSEMCCTRFAGNAGPEKSPKIRHLGTIAQFCRAISSQLRHLSSIGKNPLNSNTSFTCPYNMANFGPLTAEIGLPCSLGHSCKFKLVSRVGSVILHGTPVVGVSRTLQR